MTLDDTIRRATLARLQQFGNNRARTADSLKIGVRTLGIWLARWKKDGKLEDDVRLIRAKGDVRLMTQVSNGGAGEGTVVILTGAVGTRVKIGQVTWYEFKQHDVLHATCEQHARFTEDHLLGVECRDEMFEEVTTLGSERVATPGAGEWARADTRGELWRTYNWIDPSSGCEVSTRFDDPVAVYTQPDGLTHRVATRDEMGDIVNTLVPGVGSFGCTISYKDRNPKTAPAN